MAAASQLVRLRHLPLVIASGSSVVTHQLSGEWACHSPHLKPLYDAGLRQLKRLGECCSFRQQQDAAVAGLAGRALTEHACGSRYTR